MINNNQISDQIFNHINSSNKLLNLICELEGYLQFRLLFNKSYIDSLNYLVDAYINIKGNYPKAVVISDLDLGHFLSETFTQYGRINPDIKFVISSVLTKDYLNKKLIK